MPSPDDKPALATLTHARLRVRQGDLVAAAELLVAFIERNPGHLEALDLLHAIAPKVAGADPKGGRARDERADRDRPSAKRRRARRLRVWLDKIQRGPR